MEATILVTIIWVVYISLVVYTRRREREEAEKAAEINKKETEGDTPSIASADCCYSCRVREWACNSCGRCERCCDCDDDCDDYFLG